MKDSGERSIAQAQLTKPHHFCRPIRLSLSPLTQFQIDFIWSDFLFCARLEEQTKRGENVAELVALFGVGCGDLFERDVGS